MDVDDDSIDMEEDSVYTGYLVTLPVTSNHLLCTNVDLLCPRLRRSNLQRVHICLDGSQRCSSLRGPLHVRHLASGSYIHFNLLVFVRLAWRHIGRSVGNTGLRSSGGGGKRGWRVARSGHDV